MHNIRQQIIVLQFIVHRHLLKVDSQSSSVDTSLLENEAFKHFSGKSEDIEKEFYPFCNENVNVKSIRGYTD